MATGNIFAFKIAAKALQTETWLLLTADSLWKLVIALSNGTIADPLPLPFSHNT